jgi:integrase
VQLLNRNLVELLSEAKKKAGEEHEHELVFHVDEPPLTRRTLRIWKTGKDIIVEGEPVTDRKTWGNNAIDAACKQLALAKKLGPHLLRHTFSSLLIDMGETMTSVSEKLGHEQESITSDIYTHVVRGSDDNLLEKFEKYDNDRNKNINDV